MVANMGHGLQHTGPQGSTGPQGWVTDCNRGPSAYLGYDTIVDHKINILTLSFGQALDINPSFAGEIPTGMFDPFGMSRERKRVTVALCSSCGSSVCSVFMKRDADMYVLFNQKFPKSCNQIKNQNLVSEILGS
jgi:hypothetical protein